MQDRGKYNQTAENTRSRASTYRQAQTSSKEGEAMAVLCLVHTKMEHALYELMLLETRNAGTKIGAFSIRHLMIRSGMHNHSRVRRARAGLLEKMSIERQTVAWGVQTQAVIYTVYSPEEILTRRQAAGLHSDVKELSKNRVEASPSGEMTERLIDTHKLSPREVQVALKCAEGLTNAAIGGKLFIQEETVKFHLRNIFVKLGVSRRTELMALLFQQERRLLD